MQLEAVLERWRATRDPKLGALVIELAGAPDPTVVAPYDKLKPTALVTALLVALAPGAPLSSLVPVIDRVVRTARGSWPVVEQIAEMQPDPRLARLALALLQDFGALAHPSTKLWRRLLDVVEQHGDPSSIEPLLALPAQETYVTSPERTSNIAKRLAKSSPLTDAQLAELEHETVRVSHDGRALLEAVYADPASDGAREVYADHLLGEGDPRGEFIQLQLQRAAGRTSPAGVKREAALLKKHAKTWLGSLAKVIGLPDAPSAVATELVVPVDAYRGVNFARGFVRRLPHLFVPANRSGIYDDPVWSTVEHVHALPRLTPVMRSLHTVDVATLDVLEIDRTFESLGLSMELMSWQGHGPDPASRLRATKLRTRRLVLHLGPNQGRVLDTIAAATHDNSTLTELVLASSSPRGFDALWPWRELEMPHIRSVRLATGAGDLEFCDGHLDIYPRSIDDAFWELVLAPIAARPVETARVHGDSHAGELALLAARRFKIARLIENPCNDGI